MDTDRKINVSSGRNGINHAILISLRQQEPNPGKTPSFTIFANINLMALKIFYLYQ
jgi:hypothetical protein